MNLCAHDSAKLKENEHTIVQIKFLEIKKGFIFRFELNSSKNRNILVET